MTSPSRLNRTLLLLLAVAFIAAGGAGIAAALGAFGTPFERHTLYDNPSGRYVGEHGNWIWPAAAAASVLLALLALRWLLAQVGTERAATLRVATPTGAGTTTLRAGALTDAVAAQISAYRGVRSAQARILGDAGAERLAVTVIVADRFPFGPLRERTESEAIAAARAALANPQLPISLTFGTTTKTPK